MAKLDESTCCYKITEVKQQWAYSEGWPLSKSRYFKQSKIYVPTKQNLVNNNYLLSVWKLFK